MLTLGLESLTIKAKGKTEHLHNADRARSNTKWCRRGYESTSGLHGMELHTVGLAWDAGAEGTRWDAAARVGTNGNTTQMSEAAVWHFCRFENYWSYCCSLSMSGILMMLISTTRGDFAQPHGLETERYGNTAQMSATCNVLFLHTLKSSPILQQYAQCSQYTQYVQYAQYAQYTYYICHTERGGLHSVCSSCMFGCIVSSTYTI